MWKTAHLIEIGGSTPDLTGTQHIGVGTQLGEVIQDIGVGGRVLGFRMGRGLHGDGTSQFRTATGLLLSIGTTMST